MKGGEWGGAEVRVERKGTDGVNAEVVLEEEQFFAKAEASIFAGDGVDAGGRRVRAEFGIRV